MIGIEASPSTTALIRVAEWRRISGVTRIEYAAHVAAVSTPKSTPPRSPESSPPEPSATSATPAKERSAPSQKRVGGDSTRAAIPKSAAKIGVAPRMSPSTEAVERSSAETNATWLSVHDDRGARGDARGRGARGAASARARA